MIDSQVNSERAMMNQRLAGMGLGNSTMGTELNAEIGLQGAATGGQLEQGNIQLLQGEQGLLQAGDTQVHNMQKDVFGQQAIMQGQQQSIFNQFGQMATQSQAVQTELFNQAMQGYGMVGSFLNNALAPYGMSMQGYGQQLQAEAQSAANATSLLTSQMQSQSSQAGMMGGLFQGLGSLFGSGGGGGGILGSLGGLFGGGSAAIGAAGGIAGAAGGGGAAAASAVSGVATALVACALAREVYGIDDPRWIEFRTWLLYSAPKWLRRAYVANARPVALWLRRHGYFKPLFRLLMDFAINEQD
jgi:hypothetical protein